MNHYWLIALHLVRPSIFALLVNLNLPVTKIGNILSTTSSGLLTLSRVLCVPKLSLNLSSINQLTAPGFHVSFSSSGCVVRDQSSGVQFGTGCKAEGLYFVEKLILPSQSLLAASATTVHSPFCLWHSN